MTLGGNRNMNNPTNQIGSQILMYRIRQDATGSRTLTWNVIFRFGTTYPSPTLTTTANKTDYVEFRWNGVDSKWDCVNIAKAI